MTEEERQRQIILLSIRNNVCPYGMVEPGKDLSTCPSGFPGCGCMDILVGNASEEEPVDGP